MDDVTRLEWAWWVIRDDGDRCAGPFDTEDEARRKLHRMFDPAEYLVDYQYAPIPREGGQ